MARIFSSPYRPDRPWGLINLLSNGYQGLFLVVKKGRGVKLTTHLQLEPRSRKRGYIYPLPIYLPEVLLTLTFQEIMALKIGCVHAYRPSLSHDNCRE
jgi:hypothetical protein